MVLNRDSGVLTVDGQSWTMPAPGTTIPNSTDLPNPGVRVVTGTTDTLVLADNGRTILCTNNSSAVITVPLNASVAFPLNTRIEFVGTLIDPALTILGTTLLLSGKSTQSGSPGATMVIRKVATDTWAVSGDLQTA